MKQLIDLIDETELRESVIGMIVDNIDFDEVADRFWEKYEDAIYETLVQLVAADLFDLPF